MRYPKAIFLTLTLLLFLPSVSKAIPNDVLLKAVTFQQGSVKGDVVHFALSGELQPKIFLLHGDNPRLVVNFYNARCSIHVLPNMAVNGKEVKRIRVGIHPKQPPHISVVLDLIPGSDYSYTHAFNLKTSTLLLTVSRKEKHAPVVQQKKVLPPPPIKAKSAGKKAVQSSPAVNKLINGAEKKKLEKGKIAPPKKMETRKKTASPFNISQKNKSIESSFKNKGMAAHEPNKPGKKSNQEPKNKLETKKMVEHGQKSAKSEASDQKPRPFLKRVSFEKTTGKGEMVMFKLNDFFPPKVFGVEKGEPKVICDFLNARLGDQVKDTIKSNGRFVKSVQITKQTNPDKVRVILNLIPNKNYDLQQVFFKEDNLFVIIVNSQDLLDKEKKKPATKI